MVRTITTGIIALLCFLIAGCGLIFMHNPEKARQTADNFFAYLYRIQDFDACYRMTNENYRKHTEEGLLKKQQMTLIKKYGKFQGVKPEAYFFDGGSRDIEVFYSVLFDTGITYQKITLSSDGKGGYTVSSLNSSDMPFTGYRLLRKFKE